MHSLFKYVKNISFMLAASTFTYITMRPNPMQVPSLLLMS